MSTIGVVDVVGVVGVIGLGYVGLPLVVAFGSLGPTIGFDISQHKVDACRRGVDPSRGKLVEGGCVIDVKACFDAAALSAAGLRVWRL